MSRAWLLLLHAPSHIVYPLHCPSNRTPYPASSRRSARRRKFDSCETCTIAQPCIPRRPSRRLYFPTRDSPRLASVASACDTHLGPESMGSDQSKYAGAGEKSEDAQEVRLDYYALLSVDEEATGEEIKVRSGRACRCSWRQSGGPDSCCLSCA